MRWKDEKTYRHLPDIIRVIKKARFSDSVNIKCFAVLDAIAAAEAKVHGIPKDHVHFHEIGAVDTIIDIAGSALALEYLGIDNVRFSALTEGYGTIKTEHGILPVPAPATLILAKGLRMTRLDIPTELLTPTGCALLATLGRQSTVPSGIVRKIGYGCGTKVFENHPNFIRAMMLAEPDVDAEMHHSDTVNVCETDIDHVSGEIMGNAAGILLESGALDVSWAPVFMKKGRPAYRLTVIVPVDKTEKLVDLIILHTRTLGVRITEAKRVTACRELRKGKLLGQNITEKVCSHAGTSFIKAEYDDLAKIARQKKIPLIQLIDEYQAKRI
jgi:hypothetical protein